MLKISRLKLTGNWRLSGEILPKTAFLLTLITPVKRQSWKIVKKSLTFAAQLFLNNLRGQDNPALKNWMASQSRELFERAETLNPANDSTKIGLGATYIFGSSGEPQEIMKGIQKILEVTRRDSLNMYAQFTLGLGDIESGQYDKAVQRLLKVVHYDPGNLEAVLNLGEAYERMGNSPAARTWYSAAKKTDDQPGVDRCD